jgi:hypothetical protein
VLCKDVGDARFLPRSLAGLASVEWAEGQTERAALLLGVVAALMDTMDPPPRPSERSDTATLEAAVRAGLGPVRFSGVWSRGQTMSLEEAVTYALSREE